MTAHDPAASAPVASRYTAVAMVLHWLIALLLIGNILLAWNFDGVSGPAKGQIVGLHKSVGITVLLLSLFRLAWRLGHPVPALPAAMPAWEKWAARLTHWLFYGVMIGMPLTGWIFGSAGGRSVQLFGVLPWPDFPGVEGNKAIGGAAHQAHEWGAKLAYALIVLHVGAALKHLLVNRDGVFGHMWPWVSTPASAGGGPA